MAGSCCPRSAVSLATFLAASMAASASAQSVLKAGPEFQVNSYTIGPQQLPSVAMSAGGTALVVWESEFQDGDSLGVYGRFFDRAGAPLGLEFRLNQATAGAQTRPSAAAGGDGRFTVAWAGLDGSGPGIFARQFTTAGPLGPEFQVNSYTTGGQVLPRVSAGPGGLAVVWQSNGQDGSGAGVYGRLFTATGAPRSGEFRLSESVNGDQVTPVVAVLDTGSHAVGWMQQATGGASVHSRLFDSSGAPIRPEAVVAEPWGLLRRDHVSIAGASFGTYAVGWWEAFVWSGKFGFLSEDHVCPWIEELARRGVVGGCGGGNYCPASPVTREQMAVFVLRTLDPALDPPACTAPMFADVPASSPFCRWIEELARRGVVGGCGGGNYCPASAVTREQMAVFLAATFGLRLY